MIFFFCWGRELCHGIPFYYVSSRLVQDKPVSDFLHGQFVRVCVCVCLGAFIRTCVCVVKATDSSVEIIVAWAN